MVEHSRCRHFYVLHERGGPAKWWPNLLLYVLQTFSSSPLSNPSPYGCRRRMAEILEHENTLVRVLEVVAVTCSWPQSLLFLAAARGMG